MSATSIYRDYFDPKADFIVAQPFVCSGKALKRGEPFDKELVVIGILRGLFIKGDLAIAGSERAQRLNPSAPAAPQPKAPAPDQLPLTAKHKGYGKFFLYRGERMVGGPYSKAQAAEFVARQQEGPAIAA